MIKNRIKQDQKEEKEKSEIERNGSQRDTYNKHIIKKKFREELENYYDTSWV